MYFQLSYGTFLFLHIIINPSEPFCTFVYPPVPFCNFLRLPVPWNFLKFLVTSHTLLYQTVPYFTILCLTFSSYSIIPPIISQVSYFTFFSFFLFILPINISLYCEYFRHSIISFTFLPLPACIPSRKYRIHDTSIGKTKYWKGLILGQHILSNRLFCRKYFLL